MRINSILDKNSLRWLMEVQEIVSRYGYLMSPKERGAALKAYNNQQRSSDYARDYVTFKGQKHPFASLDTLTLTYIIKEEFVSKKGLVVVPEYPILQDLFFADLLIIDKKTNFITEIEVKAEKKDLLIELNSINKAINRPYKTKHRYPKLEKHKIYYSKKEVSCLDKAGALIPNFLFFATSSNLKDLAEEHLSHTKYGLIEVNEKNQVSVIRGAELIHESKTGGLKHRMGFLEKLSSLSFRLQPSPKRSTLPYLGRNAQ